MAPTPDLLEPGCDLNTFRGSSGGSQTALVHQITGLAVPLTRRRPSSIHHRDRPIHTRQGRCSMVSRSAEAAASASYIRPSAWSANWVSACDELPYGVARFSSSQTQFRGEHPATVEMATNAFGQVHATTRTQMYAVAEKVSTKLTLPEAPAAR